MTTPEPAPLPTQGRLALHAHRERRLLLYLSVIVAITGIQLVVPALPALQRDLGLSDVEISLVSSVYLLPSVPAAFLSGVIAQRTGRRRVFVVSLACYGVAGALVPVIGSSSGSWSFGGLLTARFVQGIGFAGILPTTITLIGDLFSGPTQVSVQGQRSLSLHVGDAALPVIGGFLALVSWRLAFFAPVLALPLAVWASKVFPPELDHRHPGMSARSTLRSVRGYVRDPALLSLQYAGFLRFFVKFAVLTYLPVLAVTNRGMSESVAGIALGASAAAGGVAAALVGRLLRWIRFSTLLALTLLILAGGVASLAGAVNPWLLLAGAIAFGIGDGLLGVLQNSIVAVAVAGAERATFVSFTGAVRNAGKFLAPVAAAAITLLVPLSGSFLVMGGVAATSLVIVAPLRRYQSMFTAPRD